MIDSTIDHANRLALKFRNQSPVVLVPLGSSVNRPPSFAVFIFVHTDSDRARGHAKSEYRTPLIEPEAIELSQRIIHPFVRKIAALHVLLVVMHRVSVLFQPGQQFLQEFLRDHDHSVGVPADYVAGSDDNPAAAYRKVDLTRSAMQRSDRRHPASVDRHSDLFDSVDVTQ